MINLFSSLNNVTDFGTDLTLFIFLGLLSVLVIFVCVWLIAANINKPEKNMLGSGKISITSVVAIVVGVGAVIRIVFSVITNGYLGTSPTGGDGLYELYVSVNNTFNNGFKYLDSGIYPVPYYLSLIFGSIPKLFGELSTSSITVLMRIFFRLPYVLCDCLAAAALFKIAKKYANSYVGMGVAAIYMLCPIFFFSSGIWGSTMSILSLLLSLSLYFMTQKKFAWLTVSYSLALLTARDAMYLLPVFAVFSIYYFVKALKQYNAEEKMSVKAVFMHPEKGLILRLPLYIVASLVVMYALNAPLLYSIDYNVFKWFNGLFIQPFTKIDYVSYNALAIYNLFDKNNSAMGEGIPAFVYSILFLVLVTALILVIYLSKKNRANLVFVSAFVIFTLSIFYMGFSALSLLPMLGILLLAFIFIKDKRILHVFSLIAIVVLLNAMAVLISAGYLNTATLSELTSGAGSTMLSATTFGKVINLICTVISVLTFVYATLIVLDISLTGIRKPFDVANDSFSAFAKDWFKIKNSKTL